MKTIRLNVTEEAPKHLAKGRLLVMESGMTASQVTVAQLMEEITTRLNEHAAKLEQDALKAQLERQDEHNQQLERLQALQDRNTDVLSKMEGVLTSLADISNMQSELQALGHTLPAQVERTRAEVEASQRVLRAELEKKVLTVETEMARITANLEGAMREVHTWGDNNRKRIESAEKQARHLGSRVNRVSEDLAMLFAGKQLGDSTPGA